MTVPAWTNTDGYLTYLKGLIVTALQTAFAVNYVDPDFQGVHVSIEYPLDEQHYPGIWVNYEDQDTLRIAGIDHREVVYDNPLNPAGGTHEVTRWTFAGEVTLTFVALHSLERDRLYDQFVRVFAFSRLEQAQSPFRDLIETNDFVALNVNWDELRPHGDAANPGTPWGSDSEVVYEKSIGFDVEGEFISDPAKNSLVSLSAVKVVATDAVSGRQDAYTLGIPRSG